MSTRNKRGGVADRAGRPALPSFSALLFDQAGAAVFACDQVDEHGAEDGDADDEQHQCSLVDGVSYLVQPDAGRDAGDAEDDVGHDLPCGPRAAEK